MDNIYSYKINNQYSYCLDQYIDIESLQTLYTNIAKAVVESKDHYDFLLPSKDLLLEENEQINDIKDIIKNYQITTNKKDLLDYISYIYNYKPMAMKLLLKIAETNQDRMTDINAIYFDAYKNFKPLVDWLEQSGIFDTIGTIVIYVNPAGSETVVHRDFAKDTLFKKSQGIWINPYNKKKFFVLDENFNKQYFTGDVNIFELHSWHGSEVAETNTFTIRVDGYFSKEFLNKSNLEEYYNE